MRIFQLVTSRQFRGAEVFAAQLSEELSKQGHDVYFIGMYDPATNPLNAKGCIHIDLSGKNTFLDIRLVIRLIKLIRTNRPDIIQANGSDTLKYAVVAAFFCSKIPIVYRNISLVSSWLKGNRGKLFFYKWLFCRVSAVVSVGDASRNDFIQQYRFPENRISVIRRGVPLIEVNAYDSRINLHTVYGLPLNGRYLIHAGEFSTEKNHAFLINAFERISTRVSGCFLLLLGDGKLKNDMERLVIHKNLDKNILFLGKRKNVQEIMAACDLLLLTSIVEGIPGVILEAGIQGLPAVAVNVGGVAEVLHDNETGWLVQRHNEEEFSDKVVEVLNNEQLRCQTGKRVRDLVKSNHDLAESAARFSELYQKIIAD